MRWILSFFRNRSGPWVMRPGERGNRVLTNHQSSCPRESALQVFSLAAMNEKWSCTFVAGL